MTYEEFIESPRTKKALDELQALRNEIILVKDRLDTLNRKKKELWVEIGALAEEYEVEPFYND